MRKLQFKRQSVELPEPYKTLVSTIRSNSEDLGGENRGAVAELHARTSLELSKFSQRLVWATWALVVSSIALCIISLLSK